MKKLSLLLLALFLVGCVSPAAGPDDTTVTPIEEEEPVIIDPEEPKEETGEGLIPLTAEPIENAETIETPEPGTQEPGIAPTTTGEPGPVIDLIPKPEPVPETYETSQRGSDTMGLLSPIRTPVSDGQSLALKEELPEELYYVDSESYRIRHLGESTEPLVLLTFDDIPANAPHDVGLRIAETLKEKEAGAIFFVNAGLIDSEEDRQLIKTLHDMGFIIGSHTYTHPYLNELSEEGVREEIDKNNEVLEEITGEKVVFFRPPFGIFTDYTYDYLAEKDMLWMNWSYGYDWEADYMDGPALADIMVNTPYLGDGANLLMHERSWTADALPEIIDGLREKGYTIANPNNLKKTR